MEREVLDLFKVMVVDKADQNWNTEFADIGVVTDFKPTRTQRQVIREAFKPLPLKTLFTREERDNGNTLGLITKQLLHYIEVYGLKTPGLFGLEVSDGVMVNVNFIRGVTRDELGDMVRELLYSNAPIKDNVTLKSIVDHYDVDFDINEVKNNEFRVIAFDLNRHVFKSGDDAVRHMCFVATEKPLLIKSKKVVEAITLAGISQKFLEVHEMVLAQVFNRHKKLIIAAKRPETANVVNRIARKSKTHHVPIREAINKTFVAKALADPQFDMSVLDKIEIRDKLQIEFLISVQAD